MTGALSTIRANSDLSDAQGAASSLPKEHRSTAKTSSIRHQVAGASATGN
ncbi:hypothetical protein [Sporisorium scitamineum]|uniref:Uncharacterized protein n=1 Tax=Sporisorium scitamineum TaxID=49012 RepID=A0A0F7SAA9_9BASI|nr:hypothetical protein [Sporisorium scitamineum]